MEGWLWLVWPEQGLLQVVSSSAGAKGREFLSVFPEGNKNSLPLAGTEEAGA